MDDQSESRAVGGVAVVQVAAPDSFEGSGFFPLGANFACQCQRLDMIVPAVARRSAPEREFAEAVQHIRRTEPVAHAKADREGPLVGGTCCSQVAGQLQGQSEFVQRPCLFGRQVEGIELLEGGLLAGRCRFVAAGDPVSGARPRLFRAALARA